jgi:hypothetical protein
MDERKEELKRIRDDLKRFLDQQCRTVSSEGYDDFVGESCDLAFHMLQDTVRRMEEGKGSEKPAKPAKTG